MSSAKISQILHPVSHKIVTHFNKNHQTYLIIFNIKHLISNMIWFDIKHDIKSNMILFDIKHDIKYVT